MTRLVRHILTGAAAGVLCFCGAFAAEAQDIFLRPALESFIDKDTMLEFPAQIGAFQKVRVRKNEKSRVIGTDISEGMMGFVMGKAAAAGVADKVSVEQGDAEALRYGDASFDRVACAFGVRNFEHKEQGLSEFFRVLKPGGRAVILELSVPENRVIRWFYGLYFKHILPWIGGRLSGSREAYRYLPASVYAFPPPASFCRMMEEAGFRNVRRKAFTFGLCRMFVGEK